MTTLERYFQHHMRAWIDRLDNNISILDVGCGTGHIGYWLATEYPLVTANCQHLDYDSRHKKKNINLIGLDSYKPAIDYLLELGTAYTSIIEIDITQGLKGVPKVDIAIAYGVLAHLEKDKALALVENMLVIADNIIITAPTQMVQHENLSNSPHVEQLQHKSFFRCKDFENLGLETRLLNYRENPNKMTTLNTFVSPWVFLLSAVHARLPFRSIHKLNYFGDAILAWKSNKTGVEYL